MKSRNWFQKALSKDTKDLSDEVRQIRDKRATQRIILYEKMMIEMVRDPATKQFLDVLSDNKKRLLILYHTISRIRDIYSNQRFICFVGPQNAGKSTLLNQLFDSGAKVGSRVHTHAMTTYTIEENVFAVDFPGSNSLDDDRRQYFSEFGQLANLFVYVVPYNGTADENLVENVKAAYEKQRQAGKFAKTIFCLNKCGRSEHNGEIFDENYKQEFVEKIRTDVAEKDFKKEEGTIRKIAAGVTHRIAKAAVDDMYNEIMAVSNELREYTMKALDHNHFIFTDWFQESPERGICGSQEVKKRIENYLALYSQ